MENIDIYIQEKLKVNSKTKINDDITEKYCMVLIDGQNLYNKFKKKFSDCYVDSKRYGDAFIIEPSELEPYYKDHYPIHLETYKIPDRYKDKSLEEFKKDFENNQIKPYEVEDFDLIKYFNKQWKI